MQDNPLLKYQTLVETIQTHPIELYDGVSNYSLIFRIEIMESEGLYSAILWRLERYDFNASFTNQEASELIFILDETTLINIDDMRDKNKDILKIRILNALNNIFSLT